MKYNVIRKLPYEAILREIKSEEAREWFKRTYRPKKRGTGVMPRKVSEKWNTEEYYIRRMVQFMTEPWDNMPIMAIVMSSGWDEKKSKKLKTIVNEITVAIWKVLKRHNPELFKRIAYQTQYVAGLYGIPHGIMEFDPKTGKLKKVPVEKIRRV